MIMMLLMTFFVVAVMIAEAINVTGEMNLKG